jgi:hypothetical protein
MILNCGAVVAQTTEGFLKKSFLPFAHLSG